MGGVCDGVGGGGGGGPDGRAVQNFNIANNFLPRADINFKLCTLTQLNELHMLIGCFSRSRSFVLVKGHLKVNILENFNIAYNL